MDLLRFRHLDLYLCGYYSFVGLSFEDLPRDLATRLVALRQLVGRLQSWNHLERSSLQ